MNTNSNTALSVVLSQEEKQAQWWAKFGSVAIGRAAQEDEQTRTSAQPNGGWAPVFLQGRDWAMRSVEHGQESMQELKRLEPGAALIVLRDDGARIWHIQGLNSPDEFFRAYGLTISMPKGIGPLMKRLSRLLVEFRTAAWLLGSAINVQYLNYGAVRSQAYDGSAKVTRAFVVGVAKLRYETDYAPYIREYQRWLQVDRPEIVAGPQQVLPARRLPAELRHEIEQELERLQMQAAELMREAETILEGEFTFQLGEDSGQEETGLFKGQAMVVERAPYDVLLPRGAAKPEIKMAGDVAYFGIKQIASHDHWYMDRQSLTNLNTTRHPDGVGFFSYDPDHPGQDRLVRWLREHLDEYRQKVDSGEFNSTLSKQAHHLAWESDARSFLGFFIHRYVAMGGDVRWFRRTLSKAYALGLDPIQRRFNDTSFPVPGLRLYVRPASMGRRHVRRGQVAWDLARGVVYVNDIDAVTFDDRWQYVAGLEQWLAQGHTLSELKPGLQPQLGGYDNDDAFNCTPFVDYDGRKRVLITRSPNMPGERWILEYLSGDVPDNGRYWFKADSRRLAEFVHPEIDPQYAIKEYDGTPPTTYNLTAINRTAAKMVRSRAAVGMFCLMVRELVLISGDLPPAIPAFAEQVIDACSKNFQDVSGVIQWTRDIAQALVAYRARVPELVYDEFCAFLPMESALPQRCPPLTHWIDRLAAQAQAVIDEYKAVTTDAANRAQPPEKLFEHGLGWAAAGRGLRSMYGTTMYQLLKSPTVEHDPDADDDDEQPEESGPVVRTKEQLTAAYEAAREASESYLARFNWAERPLVCIGGLAELYLEHAAMSDTGGLDDGEDAAPEPIRDNAFFQLGRKLAVGRESGIDELTLEGLAAIGILHDVTFINHRLHVEMVRDLTPLAALKVVQIKHGWFNYAIATGKIAADARMASLDKLFIASLKAKFTTMDLRGKHFKPEMRALQIGPKTKVCPVLISTGSGKVLGIVSGVSDISHLPAIGRVVNQVHSPDGDSTLYMLASD